MRRTTATGLAMPACWNRSGAAGYADARDTGRAAGDPVLEFYFQRLLARVFQNDGWMLKRGHGMLVRFPRPAGTPTFPAQELTTSTKPLGTGIRSTREVRRRHPRPHVFRIATGLLEPERPVGATEDVDTSKPIRGLPAGKNKPTRIEARGHRHRWPPPENPQSDSGRIKAFATFNRNGHLCRCQDERGQFPAPGPA
jgi:hypothetical protein